MLIHCWAGISRSTATAFVLACERSPRVEERRIAQVLREAAPHASPNRRIVALADRLMGRGGRMIAAVEAMGDYDYTLEARNDLSVTGAWQALAGAPHNLGSLTVTNTGPPRFFRLRANAH